TLLLLATGRRAAPGALVSIHDSGGECEMFIDLAERAGVPFAPLADSTKQAIVAQLEPGLAPANPLDAWGTGVDFEQRFAECFGALLGDDNAALGVFAADIRDRYYLSDGFAAAAIAAAATTAKPVAFVTHYTQLRHDAVAMRLTQAGVPVLDGTWPALVALRGALALRDFRARGADPMPDCPPQAQQRARERLAAGAPDEAEALGVLAAYGVPVVAHRVVGSEDAALAAAADIGYPVALKTAQPGIAHKTEVGGVHLDLRDESALRRAWRDLAVRLGPRALVARMLPRGVEVALGMFRDPVCGTVVTVGAGGVLIELLRDRSAAPAPFGTETAHRLLDRLALRPLLDGHRGHPPVDVDALALAIARFSLLASELGDLVREIDVNPLVCGGEIAAVDALFIRA
ncbi:MAG: acetate--CoA ligase family protein, partial [Burkholderiales bacterium]|nr:acetate--CoA ligase family protein [Burkholderiales bacterium]